MSQVIKEVGEEKEVAEDRLTPGCSFLRGPVPPAGASSRTRRLFLLYLLSFAVLPLCLYVAAVVLVRLPSYPRFSPSLWTTRLDYAFTGAHRDADVLIFGDSSAFLGIDPRLVNRELGIKSFVLPGTVGSLPITGDLVLRRYFQTNKPPRLLVLYLSAWDLDFRNAPNVHTYEGVEMLVRHATWPEIAHFSLHNPELAFTFPLRLYSLMLEKGMTRSVAQRTPPGPDALGHFDYTDSFPPEKSPCRMPETPNLSQTTQKTAEDLIHQYSPTVKVLVYISPIPPCTNSSILLDRSYASVQAAPPAVLPVEWFFGDSAYSHIEPAYLAESSHIFADHLRQPLQQLGVPLTPAK